MRLSRMITSCHTSLCLVGAGLLLLFASPGRAEITLTILTDSNPPLVSRDKEGNYVGIAADILREAVKGAGLKLRYEEMPWPRAYARGTNEANTCLIGIGRTAVREPQFLWAGPFAKGGISLFALRERRLSVSSMDDVIQRGYVIGFGHNDVATSLLTRYPITKSEMIPLQTSAPRMLALGRFDLWASGRIIGLYRLAEAGVDAEEVLRTEEIDISLACNLATDKRAVEIIQSGINQLAVKGVTAEIQRSYLRRMNSPLPASKADRMERK